MATKPQKENDCCLLCGESIEPCPGAVVYHMDCLLKDMEQTRKEIKAIRCGVLNE